MTKETKKDPSEYTVEEKLKSLYQLQTILSKIDEIRTLRGELPLEVQDLEDEVIGLTTRIENYNADIVTCNKAVKENENSIANSKAAIAKYEKDQDNVRNNREYDALNKEIDRQIALALKEAQDKKKAEKKKSSGKDDTKSSSSQQMKQQSDDEIRLNGSFENNRGRLPVPITGSYLVVGNFGMQSVAGMKNVKMNNLGIDIQGEKGAQAKVIFDGTVSTVFQQGKGQIGVLVRHGTYISVYCNLSDSKVAKGDNVKAGDIIGGIAPDSSGRTILHFQLHKEAEKLNPSLWLNL